KLLKASKKDGHVFGEYEITVELPVRQFADLEGAQVKALDGSGSKMTYSYAGCIDGSLADGVMTITSDETIKHNLPKMPGSTFQTVSKVKSVLESKELAGK